MPEITEADMRTWRVTFAPDTIPPVSIRAAYPTTDDRLAGWTVFKDWRHKVVALVWNGAAPVIERAEAL